MSALLAFCTFSAGCSQGLGPVEPRTETERKMIGLLEKFDRWDYDGNGRLDLGELKEGLEQVPGNDHPPERVLAFYDRNGDGMLSLAEAQAGYARAAEAEEMVRQRRGSR
jgi:Ca2+-binding EF-hand superfamily protein